MNAVDTNVLLYSLDRNEPAKQLKAQQLLLSLQQGAEPTLLLWQVLGEFVQQLRRWRDQGKLTKVEFDKHVQVYRRLFPLRVPTMMTLDHALALADRYSLSHWDSMILGACEEVGITTLYTEDMGSPTAFGNVRLVNPLT
jgi:predicted nucleic acid-binding protein